MFEPVVIKCVKAGAVLKLFNPEWDTRKKTLESFVVTLESKEFSATRRVYANMSEHFVTFFEKMANDWKGWEGEKTAESLEHDFQLSANCDSLGHVSLKVILRQTSVPNGWRLEAALMLEAGQLDSVADQVHRFWTYPGK